MRFKMPKNGCYTKYCYGCKHYTFELQVGCAYIGKCTAIKDKPTEVDAYDPPCGLWEKKRDGIGLAEQAKTIKTKQVKYYDEEENVWKVGEVIVDE